MIQDPDLSSGLGTFVLVIILFVVLPATLGRWLDGRRKERA